MQELRIPTRCGVMLLPDCTLFPQGALPLCIFEERYRLMLDEALAGDCLFAVGRRLDDDTPAPIGTLGLVRAARDQGDGTSQLLLHGLMRVRFTEWLEEKPFPYASITPVACQVERIRQIAAASHTLKGSVEDAIASLPPEIQQHILGLLERTEPIELLSDVVSQQLVKDPDMRQRLLETPAVGERIAMLCQYLSEIKEW